MDSTTIDGVFIKWLGNAGFMMKADGMVVYIDPTGIQGNIPDEDMADLLLITHEKFGHCDPDSIRKVRKSDCTTLIPENMSLQFRGDARRVMGGDSLSGELSIKGVDIEVMDTYDSCEAATTTPGEGVGYVLTFGGLNIYHAGHTCTVPDLGPISVDIVLLPVINDAMDVEAAVDAVSLIGPDVVIPMGYEQNESSVEDINTFVTMVTEKSPSTRVVLL
ncbi:MBL fold metallo-hydrolase [Methanolobus sp. WCC4]|uniref:MBL fold metallo-hydrolase n=1 Tax=Methanolobus sp. WCC4 TaxID=3125784 RepID=UPI0030FC3CBE